MAVAETELVLLPGLDGTGELFARLCAWLAPKISPTVVSYPPDPALGYRELTDLVCDRLGRRKVVLLGESFSGPIAVNVAARLPDQIEGLILAATFLRSPYPGVLVRAAAQLNRRRMAGTFANWVLMGWRHDKDLEALLAEILASMPVEVGSARLREVASVDVRPVLDRVRCPILVLHGRRDWLVPERRSAAALTPRPDAMIKRFGAPHMLLQTMPEAAAADIAAFISQLPGCI